MSVASLLGFGDALAARAGSPARRPPEAGHRAPALRGPGVEAPRAAAGAGRSAILSPEGARGRALPDRAVAPALPSQEDPARIRETYLRSRFPGVYRFEADLEDGSRLVEAARLYFQDGRLDHERELMELAIREHPERIDCWLAHIEILFLARDEPRFVEAVRGFLEAHPESPDHAEIASLWKRLRQNAAGPAAEAAAGETPARGDRYGPWPVLPDWIGAPWDLSAEVWASEIHQGLGRGRFPEPGGAGGEAA